MFTMRKIRDTKVALDWADIEKEVAEGMMAIRNFQEALTSGDYSSTEIEMSEAKSSRVYSVLWGFFRYVQLGGEPGTTSTEHTHDAVAFALNARVNGELYMTGVPTMIEQLLALVFVQQKLDRAQGLPSYDMEPISWYFENEESPDFTISELALLLRMDAQSVRNALQKDELISKATYRDANGGLQIKIVDALGWIKSRESYIGRRWDGGRTDGESVMVPVAQDGSYFSVACRQRAGYCVGKKGEEIYIDNVFDALKKLRNMPIAYWRRENANGRFGIVRAVGDWKEITRDNFLN